MLKYSTIRKRFNLERLNSDSTELANFTHFLQNSNEDIFRANALNYLEEYDLDILSAFEPSSIPYLPIKWDIPFPGPENPDFTFIDLFAGIGGFRIGAQENNGKCVFSSEWDKYAMLTYEKNFGEIPFGDITKISASEIPDHDILFAGFPCQPFSYSGRNEGFKDKTRGTLFFDVLRILEEKRPKMFLLENVKGIMSQNKGKTLQIILESLENIGYHIKWEILKSYDFGLPQMRERWYCVGSINPIIFEFPVGKANKPALKEIIDFSEKSPLLALSQFEMERIDFHFKNVGNGVERVKHDNSKYEPNTKKGKHGVYSFQKADGSLRFHVGDRSKTQIQEAFYCTLNSYSPTIIANRVPKLWDLGRKLSILESKRLQGFPDEYDFPVSDNQAYRQLGNSVSVPVVQAIIQEMKKYL
ncbi:DNA (cytosine-5-)-methyltransferase [Aequorivita sp. MCCC 1A16792]|jgi:DNA (cytosine-5)-methyltransferase 1